MDEFQIPEDVTQVEDLEASVTEALAEAERIGAQDDLTDAELDRLDALAAYVESARAEATSREEQAEARRDRAEAAKRRLAGEADDEADTVDEDAEGDDDESATDEADDEAESQDEDDAEQPDAVAAAAVRRRRAPGLVRRVRQPDNPTPPDTEVSSGVTITAAAGIRNVEAGARLPDLDALTKAFMQKLSGMPQSRLANQYIKNPVATLSVGGWGDLDQAARKYEDDQQLVAAAGDEKRLGKDAQGRPALVSAGWCAPSTTLYDFLSPFTADGTLDIPEIRVTRGGLNTTLGPDFSAIWADANSGFAQTEAQAEAGDTKACITVDCPDFDEVRLDAVGYCVKAGILTNVAYPELIKAFLAAVMVGHQKRISARTIAGIVALLPSAATVPASGSAARSVLTGLELAAEGERQKWSLGLDETLEVKLPTWVETVLRDDFAHRNALNTQDQRITDVFLDQHFADRGLAVQYTRGWQDLTVPSTGVINFPDTVNAIMYPAGTFVRGRQDVISLDAVYDTTDLSVNEYTAAFFEEAMLVLRRGYGGLNLNIPLVSKGATGPQDLVAYS